MAFDEQKIVALLGLMDGARDKAFLAAAFPEATESELNEALVNLSLAGSIEMHADGIRLANESASEAASMEKEQISEELRELHPRDFIGLYHLSDEPTIGAEDAPTEEPQEPGSSSVLGADDPFWTTPVEVLNLREPVIRNLNRNHIHSVRELLDRSEVDLLSLRGMGRTKVNEVMDALAEVGLSLEHRVGDPIPDAAVAMLNAAQESESIVSQDPVTLADWVASLKDAHQQALELRLQGLKLQQVGDALGITRERVRQIEAKNIKRRPAIIEDEYRYLFDTYDISEDAFCAMTGEPQQTYYYLKITSNTKRTDRKPMEALLDDEQIPASIKEAFRGSNADPGAIYVDGQRIEKSKHAIAAYLVHHDFDDGPIALDDLYDAYAAFIQANGCEDDTRLDPGDRRAFGALLERNQQLLVVPSDESGEGTVVRSFDTTKDFTPLQEALKMLVDRNVECSAVWLLRQEPIASVARVLDIRNGNELHAVIRRYCEEIPGIALGRMPVLTLGEASREGQALRLAQEMAPVTATDLANEYEKRYGVAAPTFKANFMNGVDGIDEYLIDGRGPRTDGGAF